MALRHGRPPGGEVLSNPSHDFRPYQPPAAFARMGRTMRLMVRRHRDHRAPIGLLLAVALASISLAACGSEDTPTALTGIVVEPPPNVSAVVLPDVAAGGADFVTVAPEDKLLLVYFGYTSCPDICPATLAQLRGAVAEIGVGDQIEVAMVTVDPERDVPEKLTEYLHTFFPEGHALRTDDDARLKNAANAFGAAYEVTKTEDGEVDVGHTALLYAVDSEGRILVIWPFGTSTPDLQNDLRYLLAQGA